MYLTDESSPENVKEGMELMLGLKCDIEDLKLYLNYRVTGIPTGELYEMITGIEKTLHSFIKFRLIKEFGEGESNWWGNGIPKKVRQDCVRSREDCDGYQTEAYNFTTFIHMKEIIDNNWGILGKYFPKNFQKNKKKLTTDLERANEIRNQIMHPVRGDTVSAVEFLFIKNLNGEIEHIIYQD